ncbi:MAG: hypothetical protein ACI89L_001886 [Phycisphaerales bacterium]|jgi:hypothetical protein
MASIAPSVDVSIRPVLAHGFEALRMSRSMLNDLLAAMTDEQLMIRACPKANHSVWCLGHIACTDDYILHAVAGRPSGMPEGWNELFGYGSEVSDDASKYPSRAELMKALEGRREALLGWMMTLDEPAMCRPTEGEMAQFAPTAGQLAPFLAFHEGFHTGQLSAARRAAGLDRLF